MIGWLTRSTQLDPRDVFPIDNMPIETYGGKGTSAIRLMYKKTPALPAPGDTRRLAAKNGLDKNKEDFFRRILPILDSFDTIFNYAKNNHLESNETITNWVRTLESLYRRLFSALEKEGLVKIESQGRQLNLSVHEVVETREAPEKPDQLILEELLKGYQYGNRVLRDAKVVVVKNPRVED